MRSQVLKYGHRSSMQTEHLVLIYFRESNLVNTFVIGFGSKDKTGVKEMALCCTLVEAALNPLVGKSGRACFHR